MKNPVKIKNAFLVIFLCSAKKKCTSGDIKRTYIVCVCVRRERCRGGGGTILGTESGKLVKLHFFVVFLGG